MKIIRITIICVTLFCFGNSQISKADIVETPCTPMTELYSAIVSTLDPAQGGTLFGCEGGGSGEIIHDPILYTTWAAFQNPVDSVYFKTTVDLSSLNILNPSQAAFIHFAEISKSTNTGTMPLIRDMIIDAIVSYDPVSGYSLIVNYQDLSGSKNNSTVIQLDSAYPRFDVTLSWINAGCITGCNSSLGQIEIKVNYAGQEIIELIDGLAYYSIEGFGVSYLQAATVIFGNLVVENMIGYLILDAPLTP